MACGRGRLTLVGFACDLPILDPLSRGALALTARPETAWVQLRMKYVKTFSEHCE